MVDLSPELFQVPSFEKKRQFVIVCDQSDDFINKCLILF